MTELQCTQEQIADCAAFIKNDGVVCFPTRSLYGLGVDPFSQTAVDKVFELKGRDDRKPLLVLIPDLSWVERLAEPSPLARRFIERFWPGPLTIVMQAKADLPALAGSGKIGLRMDTHPIANALVAAVDGPITATSANISGAPAVGDLILLDTAFKGRLDYILDAGVLPGGAGSTVIDACNDDWSIEILRIGEIPIHELRLA